MNATRDNTSLPLARLEGGGESAPPVRRKARKAVHPLALPSSPTRCERTRDTIRTFEVGTQSRGTQPSTQRIFRFQTRVLL